MLIYISYSYVHMFMYFVYVGWHLCGHVSRDLTDLDQGTPGLFDSHYRLWIVLLHFDVQGRVNNIEVYQKYI